MSRENAIGWVALSVLAGVIGMSALIRWSPPRAPVNAVWLESRSLPLVALPAALTTAADASNVATTSDVPGASFSRNVPNSSNASNVPNDPNVPNGPNGPNDPNGPNVPIAPPVPAPLAAHHLSLPFGPSATVASTPGPVERAFAAAGRGISGGFRSAGAAMRNAF
jgi:hypothetical protein